MSYLIDTNILLWFFADDKNLPFAFKKIIEDENNSILVSIASLWEICIKNSIGKLDLGKPYKEIFPEYLEIYSFQLLPLKPLHFNTLSDLEYHHNDPFDRIIVSQAISEGLEFLFTDKIYNKYLKTN